MTPQALGAALLAPGHPPATTAEIGPQGLEPPAPWGEWKSRIRLFLQPRAAAADGFCVRTIVTIVMDPVARAASADPPAATASELSTQLVHKWVGPGQTGRACPNADQPFFAIDPGEERQALETVRRLAAIVRHARRTGRTPTFPVSIDDYAGREFQSYVRDSKLAPSSGTEILTEPATALAHLPLDTILFVGPSQRWGSRTGLQPSDLLSEDGRRLKATILSMGGGLWTAALVMDQGRITRIRLTRAVPAPF